MRSSRLLVFGALVLAPWFATSALSDEAPGAAGTWGAPSAQAPVPEPSAAGPDAAPPAEPEAPAGSASAEGEAPAEAAETSPPAAPSAAPAPGPAPAAPEEAGDAAEMPAPSQAELAAELGVPDPAATAEEDLGAVGDETTQSAAAPDPSGEGETPAEASGAAAPLPSLPGELGYDAQGRPGHVHVVVRGDTLWDISDTYLGTPWVWPSIWNDNRNLANPHLIVPGDRIWITPTEMRRISREEADALLASRPAAPEPELIEPGTGIDGEEFPVPIPQLATPEADDVPAYQYPVSRREMVGLVAAERLESSASIVDAVPPRVMLGQEDRVYIGLGAGDVQVGDQFTIFRSRERVTDPDSNRMLGYHVDILGWLEVVEVHAETASAEIRMSNAEIERGDRIMPREPLPDTVAVQSSPTGIEGKLSYFARSRTMMGQVDYVYLNRGTLDGIEVGSPLEVFRAGRNEREPARNERVGLPDRVVAHLLVVKVEPETSVAFVTDTDVELQLGDTFRGATR